MITALKKYRLITSALIIVLGINVVMPTVLAADTFCDTAHLPLADMGFPAIDCKMPATKIYTEFQVADDRDRIDHCSFLQNCNGPISDSLTELDSLLPPDKNGKPFIATSLSFGFISDSDNGQNGISSILLATAFPYEVPPIFLVNSTFLN